MRHLMSSETAINNAIEALSNGLRTPTDPAT